MSKAAWRRSGACGLVAGLVAGLAELSGPDTTHCAGTWLAGKVRDDVHFFVDEDPARIGKQHLGILILFGLVLRLESVFV